MSVALSEHQIDEIIRRVLTGMNGRRAPTSIGPQGVFATVDEAMAASELSFRQFKKISIAQRKKFIEAMRATAIENAQRLSEMAVEETKLGRVADKIQKHILVAEKTPGVEDLPMSAFVGDFGLTVEEPAPFGRILSICPTTNPTATVINNSISMLAAGNTVFFAPHPTALRTTLECMGLLNQAIQKAGGPPHLLVAVAPTSQELVRELMQHPQIDLLCVTGGTAIVRLAMMSGKRTIGAAAGNPPVIVDDTADPAKAACEIVSGGSFDNNLPCVTEKEIIATDGIADALLGSFGMAKALVLDDGYLTRLENVILQGEDRHPNREYIGKNASVILRQLGIDANDDLRAIIVKVDRDHPLVRHEQMMPVLPLVRVSSFEEAVDVAVDSEGGLHHSAIIHSANVHHMSDFGKAVDTTIFVKNAPSVAGIGFGGEGPTTMTIAGATGEGLTTARTFTRARRCVLVGSFSLV